MKGWNIAAAAAAMTMAAGISAAVAPVAEGQARAAEGEALAARGQARAAEGQARVAGRQARVAEGQARVAAVQPRRAFEVLMGGSRIGVSIRDVEEADGQAKGAPAGVVVEDVTADGPAGKAGVRKGDVIAEFDGERVRSVRQLTRLVQETPAGRTVQAALIRDGQKTTVSITPAESVEFSLDRFEDLGDLARGFRYRYGAPPAPPQPPAAPPAPAPRVAPSVPVPPVAPTPPAIWDFDGMFGGGGTRLGMTVGTLTPQLAEYFGAKDGVLVTSVAADSTAAKSGLRAGDVITSINGSAVADPGDVRRRIQRLDDGDAFTLDVVRDRKPVVLKGQAERTEERRRTRTIL
jgi:serine protease Do